MNIKELQENPAIRAHWSHVWGALSEFLTQRALQSAIQNDKPDATQELARLLKDLEKVSIPAPEPAPRPMMKPLKTL